jgi:hypothetical protein
MSTLVAQTISNGTVSTSSANVISGSAKAWVNFNGTGTVAIRASYNVSSITDNGAGDYTVNFTNALADANYSVNVNASQFSAGSPSFVVINGNYSTGIIAPTTTTTRIGVYYFNASGSYDPLYVNVAIFR